MMSVLACRLNAQSTTGSIVGTVPDPSGAAVPNIRLTAIKESSNLAAQTQSDARGGYSFPSLRLGIYRVTAEAGGFRQLVNSGIEVRVNDGLEINLPLCWAR